MHANAFIHHLFWANHYDIVACHQTSGQFFWVILSPFVCYLCYLLLCNITHLPGVDSWLSVSPRRSKALPASFLLMNVAERPGQKLTKWNGSFLPLLLLNSNLPPFTHTANLAVCPRQPLPVRPGLILFSKRLKQEILLLFQSCFVFTGENFFRRKVNAANLRNLSWLFTIYLTFERFHCKTEGRYSHSSQPRELFFPLHHKWAKLVSSRFYVKRPILGLPPCPRMPHSGHTEQSIC